MKEAKFSDVWDKTIKPFLENLLSKNKSFYAIDSTGNNSDARRDIESWYNSLRTMIKTDFMKDDKRLLDRHKISACFYIAIVEVAPIKVFLGRSLEKDRLINSYLAFYVSCNILLSFMCNEGDSAEYSQFLKSKGLQFPQCRNSDYSDSYLIQTIKGLCHAQKRKDLSALALANIFCLLEDRTNLIYKQSELQT